MNEFDVLGIDRGGVVAEPEIRDAIESRSLVVMKKLYGHWVIKTPTTVPVAEVCKR